MVEIGGELGWGRFLLDFLVVVEGVGVVGLEVDGVPKRDLGIIGLTRRVY